MAAQLCFNDFSFCKGRFDAGTVTWDHWNYEDFGLYPFGCQVILATIDLNSGGCDIRRGVKFQTPSCSAGMAVMSQRGFTVLSILVKLWFGFQQQLRYVTGFGIQIWF